MAQRGLGVLPNKEGARRAGDIPGAIQCVALGQHTSDSDLKKHPHKPGHTKGQSRSLEVSRIQLSNQFDLNAGTQRNLGYAKGTAGVRTGGTKDLTEQFTGPIGDQMLLGEIGS